MMSSMQFDEIISDDPGMETLSCNSDSESSIEVVYYGNKNLFDDNCPPTLTIVSVYGRAPMPGIELLGEDYEEKHLKPNQFMCRRRLKTKPLSHYLQQQQQQQQQAENHIDDDQDKKNPNIKQQDEYDTAMFVKVQGLVSDSFWNINSYSIHEDRAILFQAVEHYNTLSKIPRFSSCFDDYLSTPHFGEQIIVKGLDSSQLAVGDVFEVAGGLSPLVVEITAPRKPCYYVNKRNGTPMGAKGMQRHTLSTGLAGWFTRVLVPGEVCDGMKLVRTKHPHPKWTLTYLSKVLYAEGNKAAMLSYRASWSRDKQELIDLLNLNELGEVEWKDEARHLLRDIEAKEQYTSIFSRIWKIVGNKSPKLELTVRGIYGRPEDIDDGIKRPKRINKYPIMERERYIMSPLGKEEKEEEDEAYASPVRGLAYEQFWHISDDNVNGGHVHSDRAILFQAVEHYELIANNPKFASCFDDGKYDYLISPTFGEQIIVEGCDSSQICVGDVFEVDDSSSTLVVEVTAPRKPGDKVDLNHHGKLMGENGIKRYCLSHGLAGWFARVVEAGELRDGMRFVRTKHPNPKWNLSFISGLLYSQGSVPEWHSEKEELTEMIDLPQLGKVHWKEEGMKLSKAMKNTSNSSEANDKPQGYLSRFIAFTTGVSTCYCDGIENLIMCGTGGGGFD